MSTASPAQGTLREHRRAPATAAVPSPVLRLARRQVADARRRTLAFGALAALITYIQPVSYRSTYPTVAERVRFARSFADDKAIRLFYGVPHDLLSVGGYTAWRAGSVLAVVFAVWALLTAAASLRGQEEARRTETLLALPIRRGEILAAAMGAACAQAILLVAVVFLALVAAGLPAGGSAFEAIAAGSVIPVFLGVGAVASQLEPTRRRAIELAAGCLAVTFALRVVADTAGGTGWLRSLSPLGWVEQMRAFADPRAAILLAPAVLGIALLTLALALGRRRDVGTALLSESSERPARRWLLGSSAAFTVRGELRTLATWFVSIAAFALIIGMISPSVTTAALSDRLRAALARVGASTLGTPAGYLGLTFLFFVVVLSLFTVAQIGSARAEELSGRLDTILAAVLGRGRWLVGRMSVAALAAGGLALTAALLAWAGARAAGAEVDLGGLMLAAVNCLGVSVLFLGAAALAYGVTPRAGVTFAYALLTVMFLWQLFGSLLGAPGWLVGLSPFAHLGLAPARPFRPVPVAVMAAIGLGLAAAALPVYAHRDLAGGE